MLRRAIPILAVLAVLLVAAPAVVAKRVKNSEPPPKVDAAAKVEPADPAELARQAGDLFHLKKDYNGALAKYNQAVELAPKDGGIRMQRANFFEIVSDLVIPKEKQKFRDLARDDYRQIAADDPDSIRGGIARDGLVRLAGTRLIEEKRVMCPAEANAAHERAESLYGAGKFAEAAAEYEKSTTGCPESPGYWVAYADAYYLLQQYDKAKELFTRALTIDPWSRAGHRFLADTEAKLGDGEAVIHQLELAVISDPVYEAGWSALRTYATGMGRKWNRVYGAKTPVTRKPDGADGKQNVSISLNLPQDSENQSRDELCWMMYALTKASVLGGTVLDDDASGELAERKVDPKSMSALEIERVSVKGALLSLGEADADSKEMPAVFWAMMARAENAAFLDEAIFLHMLDAPLAAEYPAFRDKNAERLVTYLDTVVVP